MTKRQLTSEEIAFNEEFDRKQAAILAAYERQQEENAERREANPVFTAAQNLF